MRMGIHKLRRGQFHPPSRSPSPPGNRIICGIYQNGNARGCVLPFAQQRLVLLLLLLLGLDILICIGAGEPASQFVLVRLFRLRLAHKWKCWSEFILLSFQTALRQHWAQTTQTSHQPTDHLIRNQSK